MTDPTLGTILVVDDDEVKRYTVARVLRRAGFAVEEVGTGAEAIRRAAEGPDLIVLDVLLPDVSGFEVCRRIKADPSTATIPILHISASLVQGEDKAQGLDSGADGYLTDVIEPAELLATVKSLLRASRAEEEARLAASQWQATFDAIGDGICLLDGSGLVSRCNEAMGRILGQPPAECVGRPFASFLPPGLEIARLSTVRVEGSSRREVAEIALRGRWFHATMDTIRDGGGRHAGAVCIVSDITERKRSDLALRDSREHFRLLVDGVKDYAIFMTDTEGRVVSWNPGAERILGYSEAEIVCDDIACIFTDEDRGRGVPKAERDQAAAEGRAEDERWHRRKDGTRFWASGVVTPLRDEAGELRGFAKVMRDETDRKAMEEELRSRAADLVAADRHKDEFLAMLAHELRNPLAPIRNALEILRLDLDAKSLDRARETAARQVAQMARLIDDLLDVSRITSGKIELRKERVDLATIVAHATEATRPMIAASLHRLTVDLPPGRVELDGDPARLEQVLANLLNNAAKYTEPGGSITLAADREGDQVALRIRDTGVGMAPEMIPRVFDLFTQADRSLARAQGGLGIGLTLVRSLVQLHGGSVTASSDGPGLGSEFVVRLPVLSAPAAPAPGRGTGPDRAMGSKLRVLVVDDNVDSATSLARVLKLWGHEVRAAFHGEEAIEASRQGPVDLALLDIGLPGMDGYEVARSLRAGPGGPALTLVALTGYGQEEDRARTRAAGFDLHLVKPVDLDELRRFLASQAAPGRPAHAGPPGG